jgi:Holliday junction resolvase-like predicted endonuclease
VKYRKVSSHGDGLAVITSKKLRQMRFAAEYYAVSNQINDKNLRLAAISLSGEPAKVDEFLEIL